MAKKKVKKEPPVIHVQEFYKEVDDDWHPNFKIPFRTTRQSIQLVRVHLWESNEIKINVWGADDDGMECFPETIIEANRIIRKIIDVKFLNHKFLEKLGFVRA